MFSFRKTSVLDKYNYKRKIMFVKCNLNSINIKLDTVDLNNIY